jgi:hypothetical protein
LACWAIVISFFFISVGFFIWSDRVGTSSLVLFCSILLCVFVPAFMVGAYLGSNNKMEIQEKLIREALSKIEEKGKAKMENKVLNNTLMTLTENELQFTIK